jgi:hypothetical protein
MAEQQAGVGEVERLGGDRAGGVILNELGAHTGAVCRLARQRPGGPARRFADSVQVLRGWLIADVLACEGLNFAVAAFRL